MTINYVQKTAVFKAAAANSVTSAAMSITPGNVGINTTGGWHASGVTLGVSGSAGSWAVDKTATGGAYSAVVIGSSLNSPGGSITTTATNTQNADSATYFSGIASEFSGLVAASAVDVTAQQTGGSTQTTSTVTTAATGQERELVIVAINAGANLADTATTDPPTGYTSLGVNQNSATECPFEAAYKIVASAGVQSATWTFASTNVAGFAAVAAAYKGRSDEPRRFGPDTQELFHNPR